MKRIIIVVTILSFCNFGFCQNKTISGEVRDLQNNEVLSYVNIGIANKTVGTVSDKNGLFNLELNDKVTSSDTIQFSYIGYETAKIPVSGLQDQKRTILLRPQPMELNEVVVASRIIKLKHREIGRSSKGLALTHANFYTYFEKDVDDRLSKEMGMKFTIRRNCRIQDLNFNITSNDFKSLKFRVNFYKIENGVPTDLIVHKNIVFEIKENYMGWFRLDLVPYEIHFNQEIEEIAVTIQWLESVKSDEKSKYFSISTMASPTHTAYFREKTMDSWTNSGQSLSFYLNALCE